MCLTFSRNFCINIARAFVNECGMWTGDKNGLRNFCVGV